MNITDRNALLHSPGNHSSGDVRTLALDIGGTGLKASVLDARGQMLVDRVRRKTPYPCRPKILLRALAQLVEGLPPFDRISVGFPGVVRAGKIVTAPHFDGADWSGFPLAEALARRFERPTRLLNDAEVQGAGIVSGNGLEVVLTLGTGVGSAIFAHGQLAPHIELAHHPLQGRKTYNDYLGNAARMAMTGSKWNRRVLKAIGIVYQLIDYDMLYLGGGNSANVSARLPPNVRIASNDTGLTGGIHLWDEEFWSTANSRHAQSVALSRHGASQSRSQGSIKSDT